MISLKSHGWPSLAIEPQGGWKFITKVEEDGEEADILVSPDGDELLPGELITAKQVSQLRGLSSAKMKVALLGDRPFLPYKERMKTKMVRAKDAVRPFTPSEDAFLAARKAQSSDGPGRTVLLSNCPVEVIDWWSAKRAELGAGASAFLSQVVRDYLAVPHETRRKPIRVSLTPEEWGKMGVRKYADTILASMVEGAKAYPVGTKINTAVAEERHVESVQSDPESDYGSDPESPEDHGDPESPDQEPVIGRRIGKKK
jgi:hypothetical protein